MPAAKRILQAVPSSFIGRFALNTAISDIVRDIDQYLIGLLAGIRGLECHVEAVNLMKAAMRHNIALNQDAPQAFYR